MITIIHGDDTASSRRYYLSQKKNDSVVLDGEKCTLADILQTTEGSALFSNNAALFIEDFFTRKKAGKELDDIIKYFQTHEKNIDVFLWEGKELTKKQTTTIKNSVLKHFPFPQSLFAFLDSIMPHNNHKTIALFHETLKNNETELIFFMIIRQLRLLLAVSDRITGQIDEIKRLAPWQQSRLEKQSRLFSKEKLKVLYKQIFDLDIAYKTSRPLLSLSAAIDIFLLGI